MNPTQKHWWHFRNEELMALAQNQAPLYVYNEETLNEIFFDLSAMDALSGLFYPYHLNFHQPILQKAFELDACFRCNSLLEVNRLSARLPKLPPERIFFLSDHECERDGEAALRQGLHVAVRADAHGTVIRPDNRFLFLCGQAEKISLYQTLSLEFPDIGNLILGNDATSGPGALMESMDLPEIENYLEAIRNACPRFELQLELPIHLISYAGALLMKALESGTTEEIPYIRLHLPMADALFHEIHENTHQVVNLSRPEEEKVILTRMTRQQKHAEDGMVYLKNPCLVESGDILLLTRMGAYGKKTRLDDSGRNGVPEWYLKARCLCPVKI